MGAGLRAKGLSRLDSARPLSKQARERESSHFGSSAAPLWGGLFRLPASGGKRGVALRLCPRGSSRRLSQRCLSKHIIFCYHFASGNPIGVASHSRDGHVCRTTAVRETWCLQDFDHLRPLTLRTGRRQTSSPTALTQRRAASRQLRQRWTGEYNSPGFVTVAGRATSRTTHYKKWNKPRVHSGRGDQQADLQTKTQDSSDPTNPRGSRHSNALACRLTSPTSRRGSHLGDH